ncbi:hypothetical protein M9H77_11782 [Catharanthus roseus]|uniref:Uncharacterized protein n=1 Tax=Catharanthus roseus TaxID=4058 RepID=A0ACC0BFM4_CATRO|nr:hypothetical protein M9H77_11782 [Catharanthus roseus]
MYAEASEDCTVRGLSPELGTLLMMWTVSNSGEWIHLKRSVAPWRIWPNRSTWTLHHALRWVKRLVESQKGLETKVGLRADLRPKEVSKPTAQGLGSLGSPSSLWTAQRIHFAGKRVRYHTPYLPKVPRQARRNRATPGSGFPTGRRTGDGHLKAHHDLQATPARPGKATRLGVRGSIVLAISWTSYSSFFKAGGKVCGEPFG